MSQPITVWSEIPVTDLDRSVAFYSKVFGYKIEIDNTGPNPMATLGSGEGVVGGHLYPGKPAAEGQGPTVHLALPDALEAAIDRCREAGGEVLTGPISIPPGRFAYARDLDGNSIGLFETAA